MDAVVLDDLAAAIGAHRQLLAALPPAMDMADENPARVVPEAQLDGLYRTASRYLVARIHTEALRIEAKRGIPLSAGDTAEDLHIADELIDAGWADGPPRSTAPVDHACRSLAGLAYLLTGDPDDRRRAVAIGVHDIATIVPHEIGNPRYLVSGFVKAMLTPDWGWEAAAGARGEL